MDEHQRRVWGDMIEQVRRYRSGEITLDRLVRNLQGLMGASDLHDQQLIDGFWTHEAPIDGELELRTEAWAPAGTAGDERLDDALNDFVAWVETMLAETDDSRA